MEPTYKRVPLSWPFSIRLHFSLYHHLAKLQRENITNPIKKSLIESIINTFSMVKGENVKEIILLDSHKFTPSCTSVRHVKFRGENCWKMFLFCRLKGKFDLLVGSTCPIKIWFNFKLKMLKSRKKFFSVMIPVKLKKDKILLNCKFFYFKNTPILSSNDISAFLTML